jgi:flagellar basal body-associated protein FliL
MGNKNMENNQQIGPSKKPGLSKIVGIIIVVIVIIIGIVIFFAYSVTSAPTKVARSFVQDMQANQPGQAYALTSKDFQEQNQSSVLSNLLVTYPEITKISDITFNSRSVKNNTAEISGTVTTSTGTFPVVVKLINESGWKVHSFVMDFKVQ